MNAIKLPILVSLSIALVVARAALGVLARS